MRYSYANVQMLEPLALVILKYEHFLLEYFYAEVQLKIPRMPKPNIPCSRSEYAR